GADLPVHALVGIAEQRAPLGVADDHVLGTGLLDHRPGDLARERAVTLPVEVLRGHADVGVPRRLGRCVHRRERRRDDDLDVLHVLHQAPEFLHVHDRVVHGLEHLPVAGDERMAHGYLSVRAATPGNSCPPRNSSEAPPPVEMWVIRSVTPALATAAIESPPPMTVLPLTSA